MKFPDTVFDNLPGSHDKIKVNIRKIMNTFGPYSRVVTSLAEIVDGKKWRLAWLIINPDKHSCRYIIERYYCKLNEKAIPFEEKKYKLYL